MSLFDTAEYTPEFKTVTEEISALVSANWPYDFKAAYDNREVSFGYIGNCGNGRDDRTWTVWVQGKDSSGFPSRIKGVPYFRTGDVAGAERALALVKSLVGI